MGKDVTGQPPHGPSDDRQTLSGPSATSAHYQCTMNGKVVYWEPSTREFMAFSIVNRSTRKAPEFKAPGYEDVYEGIGLSPDHKALEFGVKVDGQWKYQRLGLKPEVLK